MKSEEEDAQNAAWDAQRSKTNHFASVALATHALKNAVQQRWGDEHNATPRRFLAQSCLFPMRPSVERDALSTRAVALGRTSLPLFNAKNDNSRLCRGPSFPSSGGLVDVRCARRREEPQSSQRRAAKYRKKKGSALPRKSPPAEGGGSTLARRLPGGGEKRFPPENKTSSPGPSKGGLRHGDRKRASAVVRRTFRSGLLSVGCEQTRHFLKAPRVRPSRHRRGNFFQSNEGSPERLLIGETPADFRSLRRRSLLDREGPHSKDVFGTLLLARVENGEEN